ncbi:MAG: OmpA family protein [Gammaproteobacteria bacterium]|nr:OmpA family protein [Gammaproteobacteria bacterium]
MDTTHYRFAGSLVLVSLLLGACTAQFIKRDEFDSTISGLRSTDAELQEQMDGMHTMFTELTGQLNRRFDGYDTKLTSLQGRLRVEMTAHFGYDDASLRDQDKPVLDEFSDVIREHHANVIVTVEGFTDPAGDPEYNQWLGMERAKAVRKYLVDVGGLEASKVRAVSYGEDSERLIKANAWGVDGAANRRVALVVDYVAI